MTQSEIRKLRRGMHVQTPDGAIARIISDPYPRPATETKIEEIPFCDCTNEVLEAGCSCKQPHCPNRTAADMQVDAVCRHHVFTLSHHNSEGWSLVGDPSDRFVYALPDPEGEDLT